MVTLSHHVGLPHKTWRPTRAARWHGSSVLVALALAGAVSADPPDAKGAQPPAASATLSKETGSGALVLERLTNDGYFKQRPVSSPDGARLVFARHARGTIQLIERQFDSGKERRLTDYAAPEFDAVFAPDGKRIAFVRDIISGTQGDMDLYVADADGTHPTALVKSEGGLSHEDWPNWSPDGKRIVFASTRAGNQEIFVVDADGKNLRRLTHHNGADAHPSWSPDGKQIAFATDRWGGLEIAVMDTAGENIRRLTHSPGMDDYPAWSPDGRWLAFQSQRDRNSEIYVMRADGSQPRNVSASPEVDLFPAWRPDGSGVTFLSDRAGQFDVYLARGLGIASGPPLSHQGER